METIALDPSRAQSFEALLAFLQGCQARAEDLDHAQLVSISAESQALDPLAVLESIYEESQPHFYVENRRFGLAIAGAEEAVGFAPEGVARFGAAKDWMAEMLENTVAVGDPDLPFFGPHFFSGFTFFPDVEAGGAFPPSTLFVPRWQVAVRDGRCVAIANALVETSSDVEAIAKRIWNANTKFNAFDYGSSRGNAKTSPLSIRQIDECGGPDFFRQSVEKALRAISSEEYQKIVIARALDLLADQAFHPLEILNTLRERYADCYAFSIANGKGKSFIGASPERLVSQSAGLLQVDVLAGTAARGRSASEDAQLGRALLGSEKDLREHRIVGESVRRRLGELGIEVSAGSKPSLKKLQNVQHLFLELKADMPESIHLLDIVDKLHPTPAVGGNPREAAVPRIRELEAFDRGLYAGPIGWIDPKGEGEFLVAIRSALVSGAQARLYAGVGIVEGSDPGREHEETDLKFRALMENLI